jgi:hypothetical protein
MSLMQNNCSSKEDALNLRMFTLGKFCSLLTYQIFPKINQCVFKSNRELRIILTISETRCCCFSDLK